MNFPMFQLRLCFEVLEKKNREDALLNVFLSIRMPIGGSDDMPSVARHHVLLHSCPGPIHISDIALGSSIVLFRCLAPPLKSLLIALFHS